MSSLRSVSGPQARVLGRLALLLGLLALLALALAGTVSSLQGGALTMLPALALAVMMITRPYIGERVIARLRERRPRRPAAVRRVSARARTSAVARGGRLIAEALAGRAPPAVAGCG
jgi:hypothetical protein